jgi:hypothetical protein
MENAFSFNQTADNTKNAFALDKINSILAANKHLDFVQRILNPGKGLELGNNEHGTHMMSYATIPGTNRYMVYPEIVRTEKGLMRLGEKEAYQNALATKQFIPFESSEEADWFSKNYKSVWGR